MKIDGSLRKQKNAVATDFSKWGFSKISGFLSDQQLSLYTSMIDRYHTQWLLDNTQAYAQGALNSAYLTAYQAANHKPAILSHSQRQDLFKLIASEQLTCLISTLFKNNFRFLNTQVFFNPKDPKQKNYWHRDGQYHLSLEQQKQALRRSTVLHCRIALRDEPGIELVPGSHRRWDTSLELAVRMQTDGHQKHDDLTSGYVVPMHAGDLLVFSANMLHRGLYGQDRLGLDILYCDDDQTLLSHRRDDCLPSSEDFPLFDRPEVFAT